MSLDKRLNGLLKKNTDCFIPGCSIFSSNDVSNKRIIDDMRTIKEVAAILSEGYNRDNNLHDDKLLSYYRPLHAAQSTSTPRSRLTSDQFYAFKHNALMGCYLVKWDFYSKCSSGRNRDIAISLFSDDLEVSSNLELSAKDIQLYLGAFSIFCSFIYENRVNYVSLYRLLGDTIQVDISTAMPSESLTSKFYAAVADVVELGSSVMKLSS